MVIVLALVAGVAAAALAGYARRALEHVQRPGWVSPWVLGALGTGFGILAGLRAGTPAEAGVYGVAAVASAVLFWTDMAAHEIPHRVLWPAVLGVLVSSGIAAAVLSEWPRFGTAVVCGVLMMAAYFTVAWFGKGRFGLGDVGLSLLLGLFLGWISPGAAVVGAFGAFLLHGPVAAGALVTRRAGRDTEMPFGPSMLVAAWVAAFAAPAILRILLHH